MREVKLVREEKTLNLTDLNDSMIIGVEFKDGKRGLFKN